MKKCELCNSTAKMYCDSDQASLCWDCDTRVHTANFLVAKHLRTLLCHACQSPTPWTASGPKLGPTVSVCQACAYRSANRDDHDNNTDRDDGEEEEDDGDEDIGDGNDEEEDDEEDDDDDSSDDDNQVVPLGSTSSPPPLTSSFSSSEEGSTKSSSQRSYGASNSRIGFFSNPADDENDRFSYM